MISTHCPLCLRKGSYEDLLIHLSQHGYDSVQASVLLSYNKTYKGLIDNIKLAIPEIDHLDERYILYRRYLEEVYRFLKPLISEYEKLNVNKNIIALIGIYRDIIGCKIYALRTRLESSRHVTEIDKYEMVVLHEIYGELLNYQRELAEEDEDSVLYPPAIKKGTNYYISWDHVDFQEGKVAVTIHELQRKYIFSIPSSQPLLNHIKDEYFKVQFEGQQFVVSFTNNRKEDFARSSVLDIEGLLKANSRSIEDMFKKVELSSNIKALRSSPTIIERSKDKTEFVRDKHEYIKLAVQYCGELDKVYSIRENYNGRNEGAVIIKYQRFNHVYLLVENENLNRSAHLYAFERDSTDDVEKIYGFYLSDRENKRGLIKGRKIDFKKELNTAFNVKTLYHSDFKRYRDHLLEYLYKIG